jgi:hypothetical protein
MQTCEWSGLYAAIDVHKLVVARQVCHDLRHLRLKDFTTRAHSVKTEKPHFDRDLGGWGNYVSIGNWKANIQET